MTRQVTIPAQTGTEEIAGIEEIPGKYVRVRVRVVDANGYDLPVPTSTYYHIEGDALTQLLTSKPGNTYANEDLWPFIDALRSA
jgi:hypothetical protein